MICDCTFTNIKLIKRKSGGRISSISYKSWVSMIHRCKNDTKSSHRYKDRGIKVCDMWVSSFEKFLLDMGEKPSIKYTIERLDNDGNYCPHNCKWATVSEQNKNKSQLPLSGRNLGRLGLRGVREVVGRKRLPTGKFYSVLSFKGKKKHIGVFNTAEEAWEARQLEFYKLYGYIENNSRSSEDLSTDL